VVVFSSLLLLGVGEGVTGYAPFSEILRANPDGTNVELVLTRERALATGSIEVDPDLGSTPLYWGLLDPFDQSPWGGPVPKIRRAGAYGFGIQTIVPWAEGPLAIDSVADKIYWVVGSDCEPCDSIHRADLDGSNAEQIFGSDITVNALAVDPVGGKIYWQGIHDSFEEKMWSVNLDGTDLQELFPTETASSLDIDVAARMLYWAEGNPSTIRRSNLDGSGMEDLVEGLARPQLTLDPDGDRMWWTEGSPGTVSRSSLDGSGVTQLISGLNWPGGISYMPAGGTAGDKIYFVANPGEVEVPVPAVSRRGALALVLLLLIAATAVLLRADRRTSA